MNHRFFLFLSTLAIYSCQKQEIPIKHTLNCYIRYDEAIGNVKAEASMADAPGNNQPIEIKGGILYQNTPMTLVPVRGLQYIKEYKADFVKDHQFKWKENEKEVAFACVMSPFQNPAFGADTLDHTQPASLKWDGAPLERGEAMVLMWDNPADHKTVPIELYVVGSEKKIDLPAVKMGLLSPGLWNFYVVRKKLVKGTVPGTQVIARLEHYSKIKAITIR